MGSKCDKKYTKLVNELGIIKEVDDNSIECSVCGKYKEYKEYCKDNVNRSRTNCFDCYNMKFDDMILLEKQTKEILKSRKYIDANSDLYEIEIKTSNSLSKQQLLDLIKDIPDDARIQITQDGYYADGSVAYFNTEPEKVFEYDGVTYYSIGHSSQSC